MSFHSFFHRANPAPHRNESALSKFYFRDGAARRISRHGAGNAPRKTMSENEAEPKGNIPPDQDRFPTTGRTAKSGEKEKTVSRSPTRKRARTIGRASRIWPGRAGKPRYSLIRSLYSRVRLSTRIFSPVWMNSGTRIVAPVSTVAGFSEFVEAVSPLTPGSV